MGRLTTKEIMTRRKMLAQKMKEGLDYHEGLVWYTEMFGLKEKSYERDRTVIYQQWKKAFVRDTEKELIELLQKIDADRKLARELGNAAAAICGMVKNIKERKSVAPKGIPVAMSMLGTTTPGALRAKKILEDAGFEVVAFHQNGTGGIAMEDLIMEGAFKGVLDINLHELADYVVGGLHGAIKDYRLESAGKVGIPQVIAPGSINYTVQGPLDRLNKELKKRKYILCQRYSCLLEQGYLYFSLI